MFHRLEPIRYPGLEKLNDLAYLTVAFGLNRQTNAPELMVKADFIAWLTQHGFPLAGEWLWGKPKAIREPLLKVVQLPCEPKQLILAAFDADRDLEQCFASARFAFSTIPAHCKAVLALVTEILQNFYGVILADSGAPGDKLGEAFDCNRQAVLRHYLNTQKLKVCPGCDGQPPSVDKYAEMIRQDVDHFFAKSRYPFWAIHPLNLTPLCKDCNQTYKGDKDAIADQDQAVADVLSPEHIYHPYLRPAHDEITATVVSNAMTGEPQLKLTTKVADPIHEARLHSLNYLLNLESRWNGELQEERLEECIIETLLSGTQEERDQGIQLDDDQLRRKLQLVATTLKRSIRKIPSRVPAAALAQWIVDNPAARARITERAQRALI